MRPEYGPELVEGTGDTWVPRLGLVEGPGALSPELGGLLSVLCLPVGCLDIMYVDSTPSSPQHCEFSPEPSLGTAHAPGGVLVAVCAESGHRGPLCPSVNLPASFSNRRPESGQGSA